MSKTYDDYLSEGARNDGTQSSDRVSNYIRECSAHEERERKMQGSVGMPSYQDYDWDADRKYHKAKQEFDKFGLRGQATYDFSKGE
jgi:hypothetical protein